MIISRIDKYCTPSFTQNLTVAPGTISSNGITAGTFETAMLNLYPNARKTGATPQFISFFRHDQGARERAKHLSAKCVFLPHLRHRSYFSQI